MMQIAVLEKTTNLQNKKQKNNNNHKTEKASETNKVIWPNMQTLMLRFLPAHPLSAEGGQMAKVS